MPLNCSSNRGLSFCAIYEVNSQFQDFVLIGYGNLVCIASKRSSADIYSANADAGKTSLLRRISSDTRFTWNRSTPNFMELAEESLDFSALFLAHIY